MSWQGLPGDLAWPNGPVFDRSNLDVRDSEGHELKKLGDIGRPFFLEDAGLQVSFF